MEGNDVHTPESMTDAAPSETGHETEAIRGSMADASADATAREMKTDAEKPLENEQPTDPDSLPLSKWEDGAVRLPEGIEADADMLSGFGEAAVAAGLTRKQAQALVDWQTAFQQERARAQLDAGMDTLRKAWGNKAEANQKAVLGLVSRIDRALGDESFSRALGESGAARHAGVVLGLHKIASLMSEDSLGSATGAAAEHDETPLEGLENALREARKGK